MAESGAPDEGAGTTTVQAPPAAPDDGAGKSRTPADEAGTKSKPDEGIDTNEDDRRRARFLETENKKKDKALSSLQAEVESLRAAQMTEQEKAVEDARKLAKSEADKSWSERYNALGRRTAALQELGGRVVAPDLVLPHLNLEDIELDDDGQVTNRDALLAAIDNVLDRYPFLASDNGSGSVQPHPHADLGARRMPPTQKSTSEQLRQAWGGRA